jgi:hypothetical protein
MSKILFEVEGKPVRRGDKLHTHPSMFWSAGAIVTAEFEAEGDTVTVRSDNGAVPTVMISKLSWGPHADTVALAELQAAGFDRCNYRDVAIWRAAKGGSAA